MLVGAEEDVAQQDVAGGVAVGALGLDLVQEEDQRSIRAVGPTSIPRTRRGPAPERMRTPSGCRRVLAAARSGPQPGCST